MTINPAETVPPATPENPAPTGPGEQVFSKADLDAAIERARQQEKDKLYGKVDGLETKLSEIAAREAERVKAEEKARLDAEAKARAAEEENLSAKDLLARKEQEWAERLNTTQQSFEERMAQIDQERAQERALLEKERSYAALESYKADRLRAESDEIAPQFHDFIQGNSPEEIEQSIAVAKAKSAEVAEQVQQALQAARSTQRGASVSGLSPVGPMEFEGGQRQYSPEEIASMDMNTYREFRQKAGIGGASNNRGLFG